MPLLKTELTEIERAFIECTGAIRRTREPSNSNRVVEAHSPAHAAM